MENKQKEIIDLLASQNGFENITQILNFDMQVYLDLIRTKNCSYWLKQGKKKALNLFFTMSESVPAYKEFLRKNKVNVESIRINQDLTQIPITTKKNYIEQYKLEDRCWGGDLTNNNIIAASSGTTGEPLVWPRSNSQELESTLMHEKIFIDLYQLDKLKSLIVVGFPMGSYVSGIATTLPSWLLSFKYPGTTILTNGNNKESLLRFLPKLKKSYEQIILIGHPFFIKDVLETGKKKKIDYGNTKIRMMFCSEGFNEEWRHYLSKLVPIVSSGFDIFNTYGSSETLLIGNETPETISLKNTLENNADLRIKLLNNSSFPQIFQYNPLLRFLESVNNSLVFSASCGIPLMRFEIEDKGNVYNISDIRKGIDSSFASQKTHPQWNLPIVTLYGRGNKALIFYAANIYPENIQTALSKKDFLGVFTGKFTLQKKSLANHDQILEINIELQEGLSSTDSLVNKIEREIYETLKKVNSEYLFLVKNLDKDIRPNVHLRDYQDNYHFKPGLKPRYII